MTLITKSTFKLLFYYECVLNLNSAVNLYDTFLLSCKDKECFICIYIYMYHINIYLYIYLIHFCLYEIRQHQLKSQSPAHRNFNVFWTFTTLIHIQQCVLYPQQYTTLMSV